MQRRAFSLVELSIVLVIIGLLVGGIMAGTSLIRDSELKTVMTEYNRYKQAAITFRQKYGALPGDLPDAANYWASASSGDGNGNLNWAGGASTVGEAFQFWTHLALAGRIEDQLTGTSGTLGGQHSVVGTNVPEATLTNAGWGAWYQGIFAGNAQNFAYDYGNVLTLGGTTGLNSWNYQPVLKPEEIWELDMKMDDGMPGAGKIITTNITTCTNASSNTDYAATYLLTNKDMRCAMYFTNAFND